MNHRQALVLISIVWLGFNLGLCVGREAWLAALVILPINVMVVLISARWAVSGHED